MFLLRRWELNIASCWNELPDEAPHQRDEGHSTEVTPCLDQVVQCMPTRKAWDELVYLVPTAVPCTPHQSGHLGYIMSCMVDVGNMMLSLCIHISRPTGEFVCLGRGLIFEGSMMAYDPTTNGVECIPIGRTTTCCQQRRPPCRS